VTYFADKHAQSVEAIDAWIGENYAGSVRATPEQVSAHGLGSEFEGWVITSANGSQIIFAVDQSFPFSRPKTAAIGLADKAGGPHVEKQSRLCTWGDTATFDPGAPVDIARSYIVASFRLVAENETGGDTSDYSNDFEAYWRRDATSDFQLRTMVSPSPPSRLLVGWHGQNQLVVAETRAECARWLGNSYGKINPSYRPSALIWMDPLPTPSEYPDTTIALRALVKSRDEAAVSIVDKVLTSAEGRRAILLVGPATSNRNATGGLLVHEPLASQRFGSSVSHKGFRKGKVPASVRASRSSLDRVEPENVLASWTRLEAGVFSRLRERKVAILGCGAVGASVSRILAQTGVGRLLLIDSDILRWENIGRHELGAEDVSKFKSAAMATRLSTRLPHLIECSHRSTDWIKSVEKEETLLDDCDLVVAAMGDWLSESALSDFVRARRLKASIVYGWLERRGMAAHALALSNEAPCFRCGFDAFGQPLLPATSWLREEDNEQCAATTSPFGAAELSVGTGLISSLAIELLLGRASAPAHRVWLARTAELERQGGYWSDKWAEDVGDPADGAKCIGVDWPKRKDCDCG